MSEHSNDIIFNNNSLEGFIKKIKTTIRDNYHFVSTNTLEKKIYTLQELKQLGHVKDDNQFVTQKPAYLNVKLERKKILYNTMIDEAAGTEEYYYIYAYVYNSQDVEDLHNVVHNNSNLYYVIDNDESIPMTKFSNCIYIYESEETLEGRLENNAIISSQKDSNAIDLSTINPNNVIFNVKKFKMLFDYIAAGMYKLLTKNDTTGMYDGSTENCSSFKAYSNTDIFALRSTIVSEDELEILNYFPTDNQTRGWNTVYAGHICIINELISKPNINNENDKLFDRYIWVSSGGALNFEPIYSNIHLQQNKKPGTFTVTGSGNDYEVYIRGFDERGNFENATEGTTSHIKTDIIYADKLGNSNDEDYIQHAYILNLHLGDTSGSNGTLIIKNTTDAVRGRTDDPNAGQVIDNINDMNGSIVTLGGIAAGKKIKGERIYAAVFNDYAECRKTINLSPGRVVIDNDDGSLSCASQRLQPGAQVISDTYGNLIGEMPGYETPLAVSGRVLVYTYQDRNNYHAGMAVCSAPDGTVDIMTREEIQKYPDCIIGIVSEIPNYEKWGTDQVNVDDRIWIKVK